MQANRSFLSLNARVDRTLRRRFDVVVAKRGISQQKAVEEAIRLWMREGEMKASDKPREAPLLRSKRTSPMPDITGATVDELLLG